MKGSELPFMTKETAQSKWRKKNPKVMRALRKKYRMDPRHREQVLLKKREWSKKRQLERRVWVRDVKIAMGNKCTECGYSEEPRILQFHHLRDKDKAVSNISSLNRLLLEASKCVLLCPNCHAKTHLKKHD